MNRLKQMIQDKRLRSLLLLTLIGLSIWFGGPYIAVAGDSFLANINHRLITILILALLWGFNNLRFTTISAKNSIPTPITNPEIELLKQNFNQALKLMSTACPTYLIIGTKNSGKTTLLSQIIEKPLANFKYSDWWLLRNTVFIDIATSEDFVCNEFLKLLKQKNNLCLVNGIIVPIDLTEFISQPKQQQKIILQKLQQQLRTITVNYKNLSLYIIFTRCDLIAGFSEFFADLDGEERKQILGFSFSEKDRVDLSKSFELQYNNLLKRLNERLITRLHQERSQSKRDCIKDFSLQLELFKPSIEEFVEQLGKIAHTTLKGIYFTSSLQTGNSSDYLAESLGSSLSLTKQSPLANYKLASKSFFIDELFAHITVDIQQLPLNKTPIRWTAGIALILITVISLFWYQNYIHNLTIIKNLQSEIANAKNQKISNSQYAFLPTLNALSVALQQLSSHESQQVNQLKLSANNTYQQLVLTQFKPLLQNILETTIQNIKPQNPSDLYSALKVYLMLNDPDKRDANFVRQWFSNYWQQAFPQNLSQQAQLNSQLTVLLQDPNFIITANPYIVKAARNQLNQIPLPQLSFSVLLDRFNQPIKLFDANNAISINDQYFIPIIYTTALFNKIYNEEILKSCQEVINGNWILGEKSLNANIAMDSLVAQVQAFYLKQYANAWIQLLNSVNFNTFQNLQQATQILKTLSSSNSPLLKLLNTISINTAFNPAAPQFDALVSSQFQALNNFTQSLAIENLQTSLVDLKKYLSNITAASKPEKAAYLAAAARMENDGSNDALENLFQQLPQLPPPIQTWMTSLAVNNWHMLLTAAQNYLNKIWANNVLPQYNTELNYRYPLFKDSTTEISISDFATFFAPGGIIDTFFNEYLKPFVDTSTYYWTFKKIDEQSINIPPTTLEMFIRASLIQKMFFANNTNKPLVKFSLTPLTIEPGVTGFNLNIDGQNLEYQTGQTAAIHLIWPGPVPNYVSMQFVDTGGKQSAINLQGFWAWFRLLDRTSLETFATDPKQFKITFDLNGNSVKYQLLANDLVNPFIPGIINVFRCPQKL